MGVPNCSQNSRSGRPVCEKNLGTKLNDGKGGRGGIPMKEDKRGKPKHMGLAGYCVLGIREME